MYKVSVVIPVYNAQEYLRECLESVRNQTLKEIQVILVDDGSTDGSRKILDEYVQKDDRFLLLKQENQYAGTARNNGMRKACGEYICFLDADDCFEHTMLEDMYEQAKEHNSDIVICNGYLFDSVTKEIQEPTWLLRSEYTTAKPYDFSYKDVPERIFQITIGVPWNKLYKRSFVEETGIQFQEIKRCNDEYFANMSLILAGHIAILNKRLVYYRINNPDSLQGMSNLTEPSFDFYKALIAIQNELYTRNIYQSVERSFVSKCLSSCIAALRKQKSFYNFSAVYNFLKDKAFGDLNIGKHGKEFYYSNFDIYSDIMKYSPEEFLFNENMKFLKGGKAHYFFPFAKLEGVRNIALYGAGKVGKAFWHQLTNNNYYRMAAWFDVKFEEYKKTGLPVTDPKDIRNHEFDKIVIAIEDRKVAESVYRYISEQGIPESKIMYGL